MNPMKKLISLFCVLAITVGILAVGAVSVSAADVPTTAVDVKSGDKVSYELSLADVPEKIVGCDFSVYYDSSALDVESVADFNDSTNADDWTATINPDLNGEVRGNWSILRGVDFSDKRNIVTVNFKATKDASAHISYFVRYMYDNSVFDSELRPQIDQYVFTCSVSVNGNEVVKDAEPELNVEEEQPNGLFVNSRTGKSNDANTALTGDSISENGGVPADAEAQGGNASGNGGSSGNQSSGNSSGNDSKSSDKTKSTDAPKQSGTTGGAVNEPKEGSGSADDKTAATDADGKIVEKTGETVASAAKKDENKSSSMMWFIIIAIIVIAGGSIGYVIVKGKKGKPAPETDAPADNTENKEP